MSMMDDICEDCRGNFLVPYRNCRCGNNNPEPYNPSPSYLASQHDWGDGEFMKKRYSGWIVLGGILLLLVAAIVIATILAL